MKGSTLDHIHLPTPLKCSATIALAFTCFLLSEELLSSALLRIVKARSEEHNSPQLRGCGSAAPAPGFTTAARRR